MCLINTEIAQLRIYEQEFFYSHESAGDKSYFTTITISKFKRITLLFSFENGAVLKLWS
jgi:hypothetical protein